MKKIAINAVFISSCSVLAASLDDLSTGQKIAGAAALANIVEFSLNPSNRELVFTRSLLKNLRESRKARWAFARLLAGAGLGIYAIKDCLAQSKPSCTVASHRPLVSAGAPAPSGVAVTEQDQGLLVDRQNSTGCQVDDFVTEDERTEGTSVADRLARVREELQALHLVNQANRELVSELGAVIAAARREAAGGQSQSAPEAEIAPLAQPVQESSQDEEKIRALERGRDEAYAERRSYS